MTEWITRDKWGAEPIRGDRLNHQSPDDIEEVVLHYADVYPEDYETGDEYAHNDAEFRTVKAIEQFHIHGRDWATIAYHTLIGAKDQIFVGRDTNMVGAHTLNHNQNTLGVCVLAGKGKGGAISLAQAANLCACLNLFVFIRGRSFKLAPHSDYVATGCCGDPLRNWITKVTDENGIYVPQG